MGVLQRFERRLEGMVGLAFARIFKGKVHPAEIAKALQREADEQRSVVGEGRVLAPNVYVVRLGETDFGHLGPVVGPAGRRARRHGRRAHRRRGLPGLRQGDRPARARRRPAHRRLRGQLAGRRPGPPAVARGRRGRRAPGQTATRRCPPLPPLPPLRGRVATDTGKQGPSIIGRAGSRPGITHVLVVDGPGTRHELTTGRNVIGRGTEADIRLPDTGVSRKHVDVVLDGGTATVEDLGSTNGTLVNGRRVSRQALADGDVIRIGHSVLVYRQDGA